MNEKIQKIKQNQNTVSPENQRMENLKDEQLNEFQKENLDLDLDEPFFPVDLRLEDVRAAVEGRNDFRETQEYDYSVFVYFLGMSMFQFKISIFNRFIFVNFR